MNNLRNSVQLIGNLGADPEVMVFDSGRKKVKLALATSDIYRNSNGEKVEETQWHTIVGWGKIADIAEKYLKKGSEIAIDGKIQYRSYEDSNGDKRYVTEIMVNELVMLGKK
ncbi:MAG: single-stranded DNA-binding protein [Cytophagales bacterium]|nr:single-stranded DNA-binding protein [Cytophagales bacterium]